MPNPFDFWRARGSPDVYHRNDAGLWHAYYQHLGRTITLWEAHTAGELIRRLNAEGVTSTWCPVGIHKVV